MDILNAHRKSFGISMPCLLLLKAACVLPSQWRESVVLVATKLLLNFFVRVNCSTSRFGARKYLHILCNGVKSPFMALVVTLMCLATESGGKGH